MQLFKLIYMCPSAAYLLVSLKPIIVARFTLRAMIQCVAKATGITLKWRLPTHTFFLAVPFSSDHTQEEREAREGFAQELACLSRPLTSSKCL